MQLHAEACARFMLDEATVAAMYALYATYYDATSQAQFRHDLDGKDHAILLRDSAGALCGFSTLALMVFEFRGQPARTIFSGDTIIAREHWGEQALPKAWCGFAGRLKAQAPQQPLYWFLIVKGHRTYRYLPLFSHIYYPNWQRPTPEHEQALMDFLARTRFGSAYDATSGTLRFGASHGHLKGDWAQVPPALQQRPEVRYFLQRNPGYVHGEELVCLTELRADNLRSHARRSFLEHCPDERLAKTA